MRIPGRNNNQNGDPMNSLSGIMSVLGFAIGIMLAPKILNSIVKLGN